MNSITLFTKIDSLPEHLKEEANDYIDFLINKEKTKKSKKVRKAGFLKGKIEISDDFDEPLDGFKEYMQ